MSDWVSGNTMLRCSFGSEPSALRIPWGENIWAQSPLASVTAYLPMIHIHPFGLCYCPDNARSNQPDDSSSVLRCIPVINAPWFPGSPTVLIGGRSALNSSSRLRCQKGGVIRIIPAGADAVRIP
jgi:hypothetical protein